MKFKNNDRQKVSFNLNNDIRVSDKLDVYTNVNYSYSKKNINSPGLNPFIEQNLNDRVAMFDKFLDADGNLIMRDADGLTPRRMVTDELKSYGVKELGWNFYDDFKHRSNESIAKNLRVQLALKYKLMKGLTWDGKFICEDYEDKNEKIWAPESYRMRNLGYKTSNIEENEKGQDELVRYLPEGHNLKEYRIDRNSHTIRNQLNYNVDIDDFKITALAGFETREQKSQYESRSRYGFDPQLLTFELVDAAKLAVGVPNHEDTYRLSLDNTKTEDKDRYLSYFFNVNVNYKNKYNLSGSYRVDDSNLFGAEKTTRPLFSIGGSWLISNEDFYKVSGIDALKLRATFGQNGNIARNSSALALLEIERRWRNPYTGEKFMKIKDHGNKQLTWEVTKVINLGIDFALFNQKLSGTFEWYNKKSTDVLGFFSINSMYGYSGQMINNAKVKNNGFTLQLNANVGNKLRYRPSFNISFNRNKVLKVQEQPDTENNAFDTAGYRPRKGQSLTGIYGVNYAGLDNKGRPMIYDKDGKVLTFDDPFLGDLESVKKLGDTTPKFHGGFTQELSYKNFTLSALMTYKFSHIFKIRTYDQTRIYKCMTHETLADRWQKEGDELKTDIPKIFDYNEAVKSHAIHYFDYSDRVWQDASHIRLEQVGLKYRFNKSPILSNLVKKLELGAQASNLGLIWSANDENVDPERNQYYNVSETRFTFTLRAQF
jgi:hypothetical protein